MPIIFTHNLIKTYGRIEALKGLSLTVEKGQIFGVLGSIHVYDMKDVIRFKQESQALWRLHDFHWILHLPGARIAPGKTVAGIVEPVLVFPLRQTSRGEG